MVVTVAENKLKSARFEQRDIAAKADFRGANYKPSTIATKLEVERLEAMRAKATLYHAPRPNYVDHARMDSGLDKINERRLTYQRTRLMVADYQLNRDRIEAVNKGRAKSGFNRASNDKGRDR